MKALLALVFFLSLVMGYARAAELHIKASWYAQGRRTASGQRFNPDGLTVAHRTLPFGTVVRLTNPKNGAKVRAVVNDRGPFVRGRALDASRGVARALGFIGRGTTVLKMEVL